MTEDSSRRGRATGLMHRLSERDALGRLIEAVRTGQSQALVIRGDPGVGKTVLLEYLAGLPELEVGGLRDEDARALLDSALTAPPDTRVRDVITAETHGENQYQSTGGGQHAQHRREQ